MDIGWKLASAAAMASAAYVAGKVAEGGWKVVTGHSAPIDDDEDEAPLTQLLIFAAISAVLVTLAQRYAMRGASKVYSRRELTKGH